ncbi:vWA domain-containing protein [Maribacter sp. 2210JD10-5]|uniref:vWA domain-containing protein n=1 Tax=Maribacter sp. 2210JD10-5 TaxID=3386272 RepID=UPI0039BD021D
MQTKTILLIILAGVAALVVVILQYHFKVKKNSRQNLFLSFLRFIGVFGLLLLLINPKFKKTSYRLEKPNLAVLVDNSSSVANNKSLLQGVLNDLSADTDIQNRFKVKTYRFGEQLETLDSLSFQERQTNISESIDLLEEVYSKENTAVILFSDGNQTIGQDYTFKKVKDNFTVYPVTVGDTTQFEDLSIGPINVNRYAFLKNKYPLETYVVYQGNGQVTANVSVSVNGKSVYTEHIDLSNTNTLKSINTKIDANTTGIKNIQVSVRPIASEKNIINNSRKTVVEVIDEKTNIGLISDMVHPDLGAIKKSIESNEQRAVRILKPNISSQQLEEIDLFILYQPTSIFNSIFDFIKKKKSNYIIIAGPNSDFNFLNRNQLDFDIEDGYPKQEVIATLYNGFTKFDIANFDITDFPPLISDAGPIGFEQQNEPLLGTEIKGQNMNTPLLTVFDDNAQRKALLVGEGIWKWRIQSFRNNGDFSNFDEFMGKLVRYLSSDKAKNRLNVVYNKNYTSSNEAIITATYFDEAYIFDPNASIVIQVTENETGKTTSLPMLLKNGFFEADLTNFSPGNYSFKVTVANENYSESGSFVISDFDMEKQFVSSNYRKMQLLAANTGGKHYFETQSDSLLEELVTNDVYIPTQKSFENVVSLIDYSILLAIIAFAFATEWFIRKYNGLI